MQFALCLCYWTAAHVEHDLFLLYFSGIHARIAPAVAPIRLAITPPDLQEFVRDWIDAHVIPGHCFLTPFCLPQDLRIEHRRIISIFGPACCPALASPLPRSKNYLNALRGQSIVERNIPRALRRSLWDVCGSSLSQLSCLEKVPLFLRMLQMQPRKSSRATERGNARSWNFQRWMRAGDSCVTRIRCSRTLSVWWPEMIPRLQPWRVGWWGCST